MLIRVLNGISVFLESLSWEIFNLPLSSFILLPTDLRISNGKIWRLRFEPDARRDGGVITALRRGEATKQQAKDRLIKFSLLVRSSIRQEPVNQIRYR